MQKNARFPKGNNLECSFVPFYDTEGNDTMSDLTFTKLKKLARADISALPQYKLAVMGDCATQHLATAIRGYAAHTGLGLSEEETTHVFELNFQGSNRVSGNGLGLALVKSIADSYNFKVEYSFKESKHLFKVRF